MNAVRDRDMREWSGEGGRRKRYENTTARLYVPARTSNDKDGMEKENDDGAHRCQHEPSAAVASSFSDGAPPDPDQDGSEAPNTFHLTSIP